MAIDICSESPLSADGLQLIGASQAALLAVFSPEECFSFSAAELAAANTRFLVARVDGRALGCVALVDQGGYGEVKRLFVAPGARGLGLGRALMAALDAIARDIGIRVIRLETGPQLAEATALYRSLGYRECPAFGGYPDIASNLFLEKRLRTIA